MSKNAQRDFRLIKRFILSTQNPSKNQFTARVINPTLNANGEKGNAHRLRARPKRKKNLWILTVNSIALVLTPNVEKNYRG